ncbi:hypothetical protein ILUMI_19306 [Ignelater luminosus]|uniref:UBN2 domain-containing protein n=1 Tax=Ignelater luminosus TaxID=2038154 RepID=A0A8K0CMN2_IGNLU|nr:hypothetical protein ILUMI_19306 [Ignelater luminosus]
MCLLTSGMDFNQITLIESCKSSNEILRKLDEIYATKSETNKMIIHEQFHSYKMLPSDSVATLITKVENLAKQIKGAGDEVSDTSVITKIISTLPYKYRNFRQAGLSLAENKQTLQNLTAILIEEENSLATVEASEEANLQNIVLTNPVISVLKIQINPKLHVITAVERNTMPKIVELQQNNRRKIIQRLTLKMTEQWQIIFLI